MRVRRARLHTEGEFRQLMRVARFSGSYRVRRFAFSSLTTSGISRCAVLASIPGGFERYSTGSPVVRKKHAVVYRRQEPAAQTAEPPLGPFLTN